MFTFVWIFAIACIPIAFMAYCIGSLFFTKEKPPKDFINRVEKIKKNLESVGLDAPIKYSKVVGLDVDTKRVAWALIDFKNKIIKTGILSADLKLNLTERIEQLGELLENQADLWGNKVYYSLLKNVKAPNADTTRKLNRVEYEALRRLSPFAPVIELADSQLLKHIKPFKPHPTGAWKKSIKKTATLQWFADFNQIKKYTILQHGWRKWDLVHFEDGQIKRVTDDEADACLCAYSAQMTAPTFTIKNNKIIQIK